MNSNIAKKYISSFSRNNNKYKIDEDGSIASLILSNKIHNTVENKNKNHISVTLFGEDVNHVFQTSEAIGKCVSFCPRDFDKIIQSVKNNKNVILGCILLVDISGFTQLSSSLCTQGSSGIDLLRKITDNSLAQFVECVYLHGGDVIEFAGDSVLCFFKADPKNIQNCCHQAVRCGLNISKYHIDGTHTHVGISYGSVTFSLIGGYNDQYTYLMNSQSLEKVGECLTLAGEQELVIAEDIHKHVESLITSTIVLDQNGKEYFKVTGERSNWQIMSLGRRRFETPPSTPVSRSASIYSNSNNNSIIQNNSIINNNHNNNNNNTNHNNINNNNNSNTNSTSYNNSIIPNSTNYSNNNNNNNNNVNNITYSLTSSAAEYESSFPMSPYLKKSPTIGSGTYQVQDFSRAHLSLNETTSHQIISCVPKPVLQAIITNSLSGLSEMRTVTTLFLKFDSFSFDDFTDNTILDEFFINMQKCLFECGGMLRQFLIDDKGCVLIGLWGVPTASHAANCSKAIRCAVMMQNVSKDLGYRTSIGIATGIVYCGLVGTEYRRDYVAIGGSVNLAARLMCKAKGRILFDDETYKRLPLNVTCYTSLTEPLQMKGINSGSQFHDYWSTTLPNYMSDISEDRILVLESYIRRDLNRFLDDDILYKSPSDSMGAELPDTLSAAGSVVYTANRQKNLLLTRKSFEEHSPNVNQTATSSFSASSRVLIIRGTSASGKTAITNYVIKRIIEPHAGVFLAPVYICLNSDDDITPYSTIRKIVNALLAWTQKLDGKSQWDFIQEMLLGAFPKYSSLIIAKYIYPALRDALNFTWDWNFIDDSNLINPIENTERSFHVIVSEFLYFILSDGVPVVAIDDAHFMCSNSWAIITLLIRMGCSSKFILTIRVHESSSLMSSESVIKFSNENSGAYSVDTSLIEVSHASSVRSMFKIANDTPSRHCSEYLGLCRQIDAQYLYEVVLRPLSKRTIRRILDREFSYDLIPQDVIDTICAISRGNPFLIWKVIQYVKDSGSHNLSEVISNIKDNSFMVSMLEKLPQSHCTILKISSVIGEEFSKELLDQMLPNELLKQLPCALQNLENRGLIATLYEGYYSFSSSLIRKFVYDLIPPSDAKEGHRNVAQQIHNLYSNNLNPHLSSLCYHYTISGLKQHQQLAVKYSIQLVLDYLDRREVESAVPYLALAMKNARSRSEFGDLKKLLSRGIAICTEHVSQDQSCHRDALSAYTLSRLIEMHSIANSHDTFKYVIKTQIDSLRSILSVFNRKNSIVPITDVKSNYSFDDASFTNSNRLYEPSFLNAPFT